HGEVEMEVVCEPAFDYALEEHEWRLLDDRGLAADATGGSAAAGLPRAVPADDTGGGETGGLLGDVRLEIDGSAARGTRTLKAGERAYSCLSWREELGGAETAEDAIHIVKGTQ